MKITSSDHFRKPHTCELDDCERFYCSGPTHRLLYRECESPMDGDDLRTWRSGECPLCHKEYETKKYIRWAIDSGRFVSDEFRKRYGFPLISDGVVRKS